MRSPISGRGLSRNGGFSLLEVLVAFVIMAGVLAVLYQVFSTGLRTTAVAENYSEAARYAKSLLNEYAALRPLDVSEHEGRYTDTPYAWQVSIAPLDTSTFAPTASTLVQAMQISVRVSWAAARGERAVVLNTMRLQAIQ